MKKLSLVMSGAVSLGSFHAGVLTEVLYALDQLRDADGPPQYQLDVITGASAGSITAAIVAHIVMNNFGRRSNLHHAWVELADVKRMLDDPPANALLSRQAVRKVADECFGPTYDTQAKAGFAPRKMWLGFTLSNLNGINRRIQGLDGAHFTSTFFDDVKTYRLVDQPRGPTDPSTARCVWSVQDPETWKDIRDVGITSGGFPIAFAPNGLRRFPWELEQIYPELTGPADFTYVDGGTFNNQPIGEAVKLSREADDGILAQPRKYLFINAAAENADNDPSITPDSGLPQIGRRLGECIFAQSRTSDWIRSLLINTQIQWRNVFFEQLADIVHDAAVTNPESLIGSLRDLASRIVAGKRLQPDNRLRSMDLDDLLERTTQKFKAPLDRLPQDNVKRRAVLTLVFFILDNIANLDERKQIDINIISPPPGGLAGMQLSWFGGFFKRDWREFNYRTGRVIAFSSLQEILGRYTPEDKVNDKDYIPKEWQQKFPNEGLEGTDPDLRKIFRDTVLRRVNDQIASLRPTGWRVPDWIIRRGIGRYAFRKLNQMLELTN